MDGTPNITPVLGPRARVNLLCTNSMRSHLHVAAVCCNRSRGRVPPGREVDRSTVMAMGHMSFDALDLPTREHGHEVDDSESRCGHMGRPVRRTSGGAHSLAS